MLVRSIYAIWTAESWKTARKGGRREKKFCVWEKNSAYLM